MRRVRLRTSISPALARRPRAMVTDSRTAPIMFASSWWVRCRSSRMPSGVTRPHRSASWRSFSSSRRSTRGSRAIATASSRSATCAARSRTRLAASTGSHIQASMRERSTRCTRESSMAKQRTCGPTGAQLSVGRTSRSPSSRIPIVRSRPSAATKKRASRPLSTRQQIAPVGPTSNSSPAGTSTAGSPLTAPRTAPASRPANSSSRPRPAGSLTRSPTSRPVRSRPRC